MIVLLPLLVVAQNSVGLVDLFKKFLLALRFIRMVLLCELVKLLFDFVQLGPFVDLKDVVIVLLIIYWRLISPVRVHQPSLKHNRNRLLSFFRSRRVDA